MVTAGGLYPRLRTYRHDGSYVDSDIAHHTKPTHAEPYHLPLMVPQNVTETIMREQLKAWGHRVEFGCELRHFAQTPRTVTAYVAGPTGEEVIIAHYLRGLRIHHIGERDELIDTLGHFRESYHLAPGQCVLIRPDGYVGAFFHGKQSNDIENYLSRFAIGIKDEY